MAYVATYDISYAPRPRSVSLLSWKLWAGCLLVSLFTGFPLGLWLFPGTDIRTILVWLTSFVGLVALVHGFRKGALQNIWVAEYGRSLAEMAQWLRVQGKSGRSWAVLNFAAILIPLGLLASFGSLSDPNAIPTFLLPFILPLGLWPFLLANGLRLWFGGGRYLSFVVALCLWIGGLAAFIGGSVAGWQIFTQSAPEEEEESLVRWLVAGVAGLGVFGVAGFAAAWLHRLGNALSQPSAKLARSRDKRAPIVLLRSFDSDYIDLKERGGEDAEKTTIEAALANELKKLGPFVAIGRPGSLPEIGAARSYHSDTQWRSAITQEMRDAQAIILIAGDTAGLAWEIDQVTQLAQSPKVIIIFPPDSSPTRGHRRALQARRVLAPQRAESDFPSAAFSNAIAAHLWRGRAVVITANDGTTEEYEAAIVAALYGVLCDGTHSSPQPEPRPHGLSVAEEGAPRYFVGAQPTALAPALAQDWKDASNGSAAGLCEIAWHYANGQGGLPKDERESVRLFKLAADRGHARAQQSLGLMYEHGRGGLPRNEAEAVRLYRLAAEGGNARAHCNLGIMYLNGRGGLPTDDELAVRHYKLAAAGGDVAGQCNLGAMYELGRGGLPKDEKEAVRLYRLAAQQGERFAQDRLGELGQSW